MIVSARASAFVLANRSDIIRAVFERQRCINRINDIMNRMPLALPDGSRLAQVQTMSNALTGAEPHLVDVREIAERRD